MSSGVPLPPPGFASLSADEKLDYLQRLWDQIAGGHEVLALPDWHRELLAERLEQYRADPDNGEPWPAVRDRLRELLGGRSEK